MAKSSAKGHYQRLRERFLQNAPGSRSEASLLELLLSYSIGKRDVKAATQALLDHFGGLQKIIASSPDEILQIKGIGYSTVTLLKAVHFLQTSEPDPSDKAYSHLTGDAKESPTASLLDLINKGTQHKGLPSQSLPEQQNDDQEQTASSGSEENPEGEGHPAELEAPQEIEKTQAEKAISSLLSHRVKFESSKSATVIPWNLISWPGSFISYENKRTVERSSAMSCVKSLAWLRVKSSRS
jgi:hypothetical protein